MLYQCISLILVYQTFDIVSAAGSRNWTFSTKLNYYAPKDWHLIPDTCSGARQSPIAIKRSETVYFPNLGSISVKQLTSNVQIVNLTNNGHSVVLEFPQDWNITFGSVGSLVPAQIHWHWGSSNTKGTEHSIDSEYFPLEGHIVCYNKYFYSSFAEAASKPSGLYVIGLVYDLGSTRNAVLDKVIKYFPNITEPSTSIAIPKIAMNEFLPSVLTKYYRYEGSLTTPPCTENVIWTLIDSHITISTEQINAFRTLKFGLPDTGPMQDNGRPIQSLTGRGDYVKRVVYSSYVVAGSSQISLSIYAMIVVLTGTYLAN